MINMVSGINLHLRSCMSQIGQRESYLTLLNMPHWKLVLLDICIYGIFEFEVSGQARREDILCLIFHVLKLTPNICPCTTKKLDLLLSFEFYFCHPSPWKSLASRLNLVNKPIEFFFEQIQLTPWHFNDQSTILNPKQYFKSFLFISLLFGHIGCWGHLSSITKLEKKTISSTEYKFGNWFVSM
jgi:hypothetical protein